MITRYRGGSLHAYAGSPDPVAVFAIGPELPLDDHAVAPDLRQAVYALPDAVICVDHDGATLWRLDFPPSTEPGLHARNDCAYSRDGSVVWIYRPDAMARGGTDQWLAVDAGTGRIQARHDLDTVGEAAEQFAHPADGHMLLNVGEGQDGQLVCRGRLDGDRIELTAYRWRDRILLGLAPDGHQFMTVDQDQGDAAFHAYPGGKVIARVKVRALGHKPSKAFIDWSGGYLDDRTAVVTAVGDSEDDLEWYERHAVDPHTGKVRGRIDHPAAHEADFEPLGDGTWATGSADDLPRWFRFTG